MCKTKCLFLFFLLLLPAISWTQQAFKADYQAGVVVFKLKSAYNSTYDNRQAGGESASQLVTKLKTKARASNILQPFAALKNAKNKNQVQKQGSAALDGIFKMVLPAGVSVEEVIEMLQLQPEVEYAEPYYLPQMLETPNDPFLANNQPYLAQVKAPEAWQMQQGSRNIIIGILDSGVDTTHLDLRANLYKNENDPIDGIDNDGDGYIDNYWGWDFANNDNNPRADQSGHGTQVTGVCSATTNNGIGVAGTGYNTQYMPIKVFSSKDGSFVNGYEAIVYAADMGCQVINLSWGSPGAPSKYVQDIINYVVHEKDVVVIAAAGNTAEELDFYPASYENVLSVSASNAEGQLAEWCTWSRFVDILAPGVVYTTGNNNRYYAAGGTSYSSPMVAGAAALLRAQFPELNASQIMELLRKTANGVPENEFRSGNGLLNMEAALQGMNSSSVRMSNLKYSNGIGTYAFHSDTISLSMDFTNYLNVASDVTIKLIAENDYATVLEETVQLGSLGTLETKSNQAPLRFKLSAELPPLEILSFRLEYSSPEGYKDYQYFNLRTSGEYIDFKVDDLTLTIASNGNLGYNYDYNLQGLGLRYQNAPLAHNMGLAIAQNPTAIANNIVNNMQPTRRDLDFKTLERLRLYNHSQASMDARSSFEVIVGDSSQLNLMVDQKILGWSKPGDAAAVVLEYKIMNRADTAYENLHIALFSDFNLMDAFQNRAQWDASHQLGYTYNESTGRYAGIALLTEQEQIHYALDLKTREGNTADVGNRMSRRHKLEFLNKGIANTAAGEAGRGNDVAKFLGGTIRSLAPQTAEKVVFAMVTAPSLEALQAATTEARSNYADYLAAIPPLLTAIAVCPGEPTHILPKAGSLYRFYSTKEDVSAVAEGESLSLPGLHKDTTIYALNIDKAWGGMLERIDIKVMPLAPDFTMSANMLTLEAGLHDTLSVTALSNDAISWHWDFGNGITSTARNPKVIYSAAGTYEVKLSVTNAGGCVLSSSQRLEVKSLPVVEKILSYPNPTTGQLTLELPTYLPAGGELLIMDLTGHKLIQQSLGAGKKLALDLHTFPKGIYLIRVMHGGLAWHSRVIRQ